MAVASVVYPEGISAMCQGDFSWAAGGSALVGVLVADSYTPAETHSTRNDLTEPTSAVETALTEEDPVVDAANNQIEFGTDDTTVTFSSPDNGQVVGGMAVAYNAGGATTADPIICLCDFTLGNVTADGSTDIIVTQGSDGWFKMTWVSY